MEVRSKISPCWSNDANHQHQPLFYNGLVRTKGCVFPSRTNGSGNVSYHQSEQSPRADDSHQLISDYVRFFFSSAVYRHWYRSDPVKRTLYTEAVDQFEALGQEFKWDSKLVRLAMRQYVANSLEKINNHLRKELEGKFPDLPHHECILHPCFKEDLQLLEKLKEKLLIELADQFPWKKIKVHFDSTEKKDFYKELLEEGFNSAVNDLHKTELSEMGRIIIQSVNQYIEPYIQADVPPTDAQIKRESFLVKLEKQLKESHSVDQLSVDQIQLTFFVYLRKALEAISYRLDKATHQIDREEIKRTLHEAIEIDFPLEYRQRLLKDFSNKMVDPELTREMMILCEKNELRTKIAEELEMVPKVKDHSTISGIASVSSGTAEKLKRIFNWVISF